MVVSDYVAIQKYCPTVLPKGPVYIFIAWPKTLQQNDITDNNVFLNKGFEPFFGL